MTNADPGIGTSPTVSSASVMAMLTSVILRLESVSNAETTPRVKCVTDVMRDSMELQNSGIIRYHVENVDAPTLRRLDILMPRAVTWTLTPCSPFVTVMTDMMETDVMFVTVTFTDDLICREVCVSLVTAQTTGTRPQKATVTLRLASVSNVCSSLRGGTVSDVRRATLETQSRVSA